MQEEVENRTVNFVVTTSKLTARTMAAAMRRFLQRQENYRQEAKTERRQVKAVKKTAKAREKAYGRRGKQTVKELVRKGDAVKKLPVKDTELKEFEKILRKYGVDFSIVADASSARPKYLVFFKARDEEVIAQVYNESLAKLVKAPEKKAARPSLLAALQHFKEIAQQTPERAHRHEQEHSL